MCLLSGEKCHRSGLERSLAKQSVESLMVAGLLGLFRYPTSWIEAGRRNIVELGGWECDSYLSRCAQCGSLGVADGSADNQADATLGMPTVFAADKVE